LINEESLRDTHELGKTYDPKIHHYFGYYNVDIFNCPEFIMFTNNDCPRARDIIFHREFEPMSMTLWCKLVRNKNSAIDIGAHVGIYSLSAASARPDMKVLAVEPNPDAYARLLMHCEINNFSNIQLVRSGIANQVGLAKLSWRKKPNGNLSSGSSFVGNIPKKITAENIHSPVTKLDSLIEQETINSPMIIKIDVEGAEELVIDSMPITLKYKPDIIIETFLEKSAKKITEATSKLGYDYFLIDEKNMRLIKQDRLKACSLKSDNFNQFMTTDSKSVEEFL